MDFDDREKALADRICRLVDLALGV